MSTVRGVAVGTRGRPRFIDGGRRSQLSHIRAGLRTLRKQQLPTAGMFPAPDVDLVHMNLVGRHYFVSRAPEHVKHVFIEGHDRYRKAVHYRLLATVTGNGLLTNEGEHWASQRRLVQPVFAKRHIDALVPHMTAATDAFVARWTPATPPSTTDVAAAMTELTLDVVGRALFGATLVDAAARLGPAVQVGLDTAVAAARLQMVLGLPGRAIDAIGSAIYRAPLPPPADRIRRAMHTIDDVVNEIISERITSGTEDEDDLLGLLLGARDEDGDAMPRRQVRDELVTMMLAGHETTTNALSWLWYLLALNVDFRERVVAEVSSEHDLDSLVWTRAALQEALRLYPPAWVLEREAMVDDELDGRRVPKGSTVMFPVLLIHRDPRWWPDPDAFNPTRFLPGAPTPERGTYLPFGAGRRICVGANFALTEGTLIAATLLRRYRFDLAPGTEISGNASVTLRPRGGLPMLVTRTPY